MNEKHLLRFITFTPIIFIPTIVFAIFFINISHTQDIFNNSSKNLQEELILKEKNITISKVKMAISLINYEHSTIEERLHIKVKDRVEKAFAIGSNIYKQNREKKSDTEIKKIILDALRPLLWNDGESFIFILDKEGNFILSPEYLIHMEGKNIIDFKDATDKSVIQEEIRIVKEEGEGFLWNTFTRAKKDINSQYKQLAFVKDFEHFNWYMGSAEYLDTTTHEIEKSTLTLLRNINKNSQDYFFIFDMDGNIILHSYNPELEGKNLFASSDKNHSHIVEQFIKNAKEGSNNFVPYTWENPKNGKFETKLSYVEKIPNTNWVIGSGFYTKEIEKIAESQIAELQKINEAELLILKFYSIVFVVISVIASIFISRKLKDSFDWFKKNLAKKSNELQELNEELEEKIHHRTQELEDAYIKMQHIANTDSLTQIKNRYSFLNAFNAELQKHKKEQREFPLIMFDIDHFKLINDNYGHDVGDIVIVEITQAVRECLRENDIFGRIGGEEFMIFLPYTSIYLAEEIAQRVRKAVEEYPFSVIEHVTISLGVATYINGEEGSDMLKRVDTALYEAKTQGRNRVVTH
ncbi:MAG: cache domain-containing protein [Sulfurimonas sp.]|nr:cache domain-containing protein [Sulfurimonas sp.]